MINHRGGFWPQAQLFISDGGGGRPIRIWLKGGKFEGGVLGKLPIGGHDTVHPPFQLVAFGAADHIICAHLFVNLDPAMNNDRALLCRGLPSAGATNQRQGPAEVILAWRKTRVWPDWFHND